MTILQNDIKVILQSEILQIEIREVKSMILDREKINLAMARKVFTIANLADAYGVSGQRMRTILNSRRVSPATAGRLAVALDCDVTEIIEIEN